LFEKGLNIDKVVVSSGSTGTHAGLITGFAGCNMNIPIYGINVSRDTEIQEKMVFDLVEKTADHVGIKGDIDSNLVKCFDAYWRPHYSLPNRRMVEAVSMLAQTEGILTDPIYTGKALAGLIDLSRKGTFKKGEKVMFVHTGGSPALYAYIPVILGDEKVEDE
jgi:D-cysteine desulfhydrase